METVYGWVETHTKIGVHLYYVACVYVSLYKHTHADMHILEMASKSEQTFRFCLRSLNCCVLYAGAQLTVYQESAQLNERIHTSFWFVHFFSARNENERTLTVVN